MTKDNQRLIINRIVDYLVNTIDNKDVTKEFFKMYSPSGEVNIKNQDKAMIKNVTALGLPDLGDNVMENDKIKSAFVKPPYYPETEMEIDGKKQTVKAPEPVEGDPDNEKMADVTNRATAITHAFAILQELIPIHDTLDEYKNRIEELESKVSKLESEVRNLKAKVN